MKKLTIELNDKTYEMLEEITIHIIKIKNENTITDDEMEESIKALILKGYLSEIIPIKYGENTKVTMERLKE